MKRKISSMTFFYCHKGELPCAKLGNANHTVRNVSSLDVKMSYFFGSRFEPTHPTASPGAPLGIAWGK